MFAMLLFASVALVACGGGGADQEDVDGAYNSLMIYDTTLGQIRGGFNVPLEGRNGVEVSWEIGEGSEDFLALGDVYEPSEDGDLREQRILVTRPEEGEEHADITLIATLTKGDASATKEFEGRVMAMPPIDTYDSIADLYNQASVGDDVRITATVVARVGSGYFVSDGTHVLSIFRGGSHDIGQTLEITGQFARWNTLYQISSPDSVEPVGTDDIDLDAIDMTFDELFDEDVFDYSSPTTHGMKYRLEGIVVQGDLAGSGYTNWYLQDVQNPEQFVMFTHYSTDESLDYIATYEGEFISIDVRLYARHGADGFLMFFDQDDVDVDVLELDEELVLGLDKDAVERETYLATEDIALPSEGTRGSEITNWTSSDSDIMDNDGNIVNMPDGIVELTFTADIALGEYSDTLEITVIVVGMDPVSVDDALNTADGELTHVEGVVTGFNFDAPGFYLQDEDGTGIYVRLFSRDEYMLDELEVGNKISIVGEIDRYSSHGNNQKQISGNKVITSNDGGDHDLYVETDMSIEDIINGFVPFDGDNMADDQPGGITNSVIYRIEGNFEIALIDFGDANIDVGLDMNLIFDLDNTEAFGYGEDDVSEGDVITSMTFITERIHFGNYRVVVIDIEFED